jgi:hypothetical protein
MELFMKFITKIQGSSNVRYSSRLKIASAILATGAALWLPSVTRAANRIMGSDPVAAAPNISGIDNALADNDTNAASVPLLYAWSGESPNAIASSHDSTPALVSAQLQATLARSANSTSATSLPTIYDASSNQQSDYVVSVPSTPGPQNPGGSVATTWLHGISAVTAVPEPATALAVLGGVSYFGLRRRRRVAVAC